MKKLLTLLAIAILWSMASYAQDSCLVNKIAELEGQVSGIQQMIFRLQSKVDEVTRQNLALKQALHLQPTIAEATTEGLNVRLIESSGDSITGDITFRFSVTNTTDKDILYPCRGVDIINENGYALKSDEIKECIIANRPFSQSALYIYPDTPIEMMLTVNMEDKSQYAKIINIGSISSGYNTRFTNIPIKWK